MSKSIKLKNDVYLSTESIVHGTEPLIESGTWTPKIQGRTTAGTATYSFNNGAYTKIGNVVFYIFNIGLASFSGGSGRINVAGLPFGIKEGLCLGQLVAQGTIFDDNQIYHLRGDGNGENSAFLIETNSNMNNVVSCTEITSIHYIYGSGFYFTK